MPFIRQRAALTAIAGLILVVCWHGATVHANYGGNWTALFCTGALRGAPPSLAQENIYLFAGSQGYDGQIYHYMAHDPWMRDPGLRKYVDEPRFRHRRILVPALAWALAFGRSEWIDRAYYIVFLLFVGMGIYWSCRICEEAGLPTLCGLLFLLLPATLVGIDRMVIDLALGSLSVGFVYYFRRADWRLGAVLMAGALTRETGFVLIAAYVVSAVWQRRWRHASFGAAAAVPALAWYGWVQIHTVPYRYETSFIPLSGTFASLIHPEFYPANVPLAGVISISDAVGLLGILLGFAMGIWQLYVGRKDAVGIAAGMFALIGILVQRADFWTNAFNYGRIYTPLLIFLAVNALRERSWLGLIPWVAISLRVGLQFGPQVLGILRRPQ